MIETKLKITDDSVLLCYKDTIILKTKLPNDNDLKEILEERKELEIIYCNKGFEFNKEVQKEIVAQLLLNNMNKENK